MGSTPNERALIEAVISLIEQELGQSRANVRQCDDDRVGPPVDCRFEVGARSFAIEHTIIESFSDQIGLGDRFARFAAALEEGISNRLPVPGTYYLNFDIAPTSAHKPRAQADLRRQILEWVARMAADLHAEFPSRATRRERPYYFGSRESVIDGVRVKLDRRVVFSDAERHDGRVFIGRMVADLKEARRARAAQVMEDKLGKLARCAADGDETYLILENQDGQLGNHIEIAFAIEPLLDTRYDWPSVIFVADTCTDNDWTLWPIILRGRMALDTCEYIEFDARALLERSADQSAQRNDIEK